MANKDLIRSAKQPHLYQSDSPCWRFRAMAPSEPNQNPIQGELFSANLPERFIRESIQNSLDARAGAEPVAVRFTISGPEGAVPGERAGRYLEGLRPHLEAVKRAASAGLERGSERRQYTTGIADKPRRHLRADRLPEEVRTLPAAVTEV